MAKGESKPFQMQRNCAIITATLFWDDEMLRAYVLIETATGAGPNLASLLRSMKEVRSADRVTGPHDVIVVAEVVDLEALGKWLSERVHPLPGIQKTLTCVVVSQ